MKILLTGAAGFIGSHTADLLLDDHHQVFAIDNFSTGHVQNLTNFCARGGKLEQVNITRLQEVLPVVRDFSPDAIIHLAAQPSLGYSEQFPHQDLVTNIVGTLNMLIAGNNFKVKRFVLASTSAVYQELNPPRIYTEDYIICPQSPYGISKASAEMYVRKYFPKSHVILRYGNVFGPRQVPLGENQLIARAIRHFVEGAEFQVNGTGKQKRDFVYVNDVAWANLLAAKSDDFGTFNISKGQAVSVEHVLGLLEQVYEVSGYPWEHNNRVDLREHICLGVAQASKRLNWRATTPLLDGLRITAKWWNAKQRGSDD